MSARILIIEDDQDLATSIADWLGKKYHVECVRDGAEGISRLTHYEYDVAIVDWELPVLSGIEVIQAHRNRNGKTRILMLTGRRQVADKEHGFEVGADDYLCKPFEVRELSARISALLRRPGLAEFGSIKVGDLELNREFRSVSRGGKAIKIRPQEFTLLTFLMRNPRRVFSIEELIEKVWGMEDAATPEGVRASIMRLRAAIHDDEGQIVQTLRGMGYKLEPAEPA